MYKNLHIARNLSLPPEAVTQTFAILAKRGVGKTYCAMVLTEELLKTGLRVVVIDPVGVCWGLRASADGKKAGLPIIIFGGEKSDVPLEVSGGAIVADIIVDEQLSAVLDLSLFRKGEQVRFMTDFAERLYHKNRKPLHLVMDEADMFAPQRPMRGQERMLGAVEDIVRRGRARGIGVTLVTQRSAVLNKDVLTQIEVLVALRTISPQDRAAIDAWIHVHGTEKEREELMSSLASLPIGTAWFWSPGWLNVFKRVDIRKRETFDSSATPEVSTKTYQAPKKLADVNIEVLRKKMADTIERVKADDPRELRNKILQLQRELKSTTGVEVKTETKEISVLTDEDKKNIELIMETIGKQGIAIESLLKYTNNTKQAIENVLSKIAKAVNVKTSHTEQKPISPLRARPDCQTNSMSREDIRLRAGERKILETLARHHPAQYTKNQLGTLSGYTASGGTFLAYFGNLKRQEFIHAIGGRGIGLTDAGLAFVGQVTLTPQTTGEIVEMWKKALRGGESKILNYLVEIFPRTTTKEALSEEVGYTYTGGTFSAYIGTLKRNGLIEISGGQIGASPTLFEV